MLRNKAGFKMGWELLRRVANQICFVSKGINLLLKEYSMLLDGMRFIPSCSNLCILFY